MKSVLVTGGAGFIGSHTVVELDQAGYQPIIVDDFSNSKRSVIQALEKLLGKPVIVYDQAYQDIDKLKAVFNQHKIDAVIHFAAFKAVGESAEKPLEYYANNVSGLIRLMEYLSSISDVKNFVFSSSCTVYGEPDKLPVTESSPMRPASSPYGSTKQMGETIMHDVATVSKSMNGVSLRYFNPIGAHPSALIGELPIGRPNNLVPFITQTAAGWQPELIVYGNDYPTSDGSAVRDYIHVVDLAKAHVQALTYLEKQAPGFYDIFNVGTGKGSSVLEVIKTFEEATGQKLAYKIGPKRKGDLTATYAATDKARDTLGWKAEKSLADGLADAWHWQQQLKKPD